MSASAQPLPTVAETAPALPPRTIDPAPSELAAAIEASRKQLRAELRRQTIKTRCLQTGIFLIFILGWEAGARLGLLRRIFFSSPSEVAIFIVQNWPTLLSNIGATLWAAGWGYVLGCGSGILVGLALAHFRSADRVVDPFLTMLNGLPRIALAPLFLLWFGISVQAKVALAVSLVFFILFINTRAAAREVAGDLIKMGIVLGGTTLQRLLYIIIPGSLPGIFAGLRIGVVYSVFGIVASEMVIARSGLGTIALLYGQNLQTDGVFAILAITALLAWTWTGLVVVIEKLVLVKE